MTPTPICSNDPDEEVRALAKERKEMLVLFFAIFHVMLRKMLKDPL